MKKVVTLGEVLLRLSPPGRNKIIGSSIFEVNVGGSEANVAVALSQFGIDTSLITKLPDNELGDVAINKLREFGVNTTYIVRGGDRIGIYFLENGYSFRPNKVLYDRKNSAMSKAKIKEFDLDQIFMDRDLLHVSGITLGISEEGFQLGKALIQAAAKRGLKVSFDFNYRSRLWSIDQAREKFEQVLKYVDIAFAGDFDFINILGIEPDKSLENDILVYYEDLYSKVQKKYNFEWIVSSVRSVESASRNDYQGIIYNGKEFYYSNTYSIDIIDRVGTGDALTAGFLYAYLSNKNNEYKVQFATASSALKHTIPGDMLVATIEEIENLFMIGSFTIQR
ncbi:sugar kinase [Aeribacillus composti]|uniref:sugar kinase n=1 Tax=Aeribacillus composti TaxID=1868734 RepID=UPI002E1FA525|nr:sugar kinase [Aeribacillus composti]